MLAFRLNNIHHLAPCSWAQPNRTTFRFGYRLEIQPGDQLNQVLYKVAGPKFPAIRAYGYDIGRVNFQQKMFDLPRRLSLQMFDADLCTEVAQKLQSFHCKTPEVTKFLPPGPDRDP